MGLIDLNTVSFWHGDKQILTDLSLSVDDGEVVLIIGPTGSGKSTLLQVLAGVAPQVTGGRVKGQVAIGGVDVLHDPTAIRGKVGLVLQDPEPQLINLTVTDEVAFGPENLQLPKVEINRRVAWAIQACRLSGLENSLVYALSGGQKQRIAIAAGLAMKPDILLLDGPMTNLDPAGAEEVLSTLRQLIADRITQIVMIVANKTDALLSLATRIVVLVNGSIILDGTPEEIYGNHHEALIDAGLFLPEVTSLWPTVKRHAVGSRLPRTPEAAVSVLSGLHPWLMVGQHEEHGNGNQIVIGVNRVGYAYGDNQVLRDINLTVRKGEFLAVVGQNGSGKSTLMSLITGLKKPSQGTISVLGKDTVQHPPQGHVGYVFQYPDHQFVARTVEEELSYGLTARLGEDEVVRRVREMLELFGMENRRLDSPYTLSVGEKRMLSVATMLVMRPEILILDEPTTGLDRHLTQNLMNILQQYVLQYGLTVIQVSHDMEQIAEYCNRVLVIDGGTVTFTGTPRELFLERLVLEKTKLAAPPICRIAMSLFPGETVPITVAGFLTEVSYAAT